MTDPPISMHLPGIGVEVVRGVGDQPNAVVVGDGCVQDVLCCGRPYGGNKVGDDMLSECRSRAHVHVSMSASRIALYDKLGCQWTAGALRGFSSAFTS